MSWSRTRFLARASRFECLDLSGDDTMDAMKDEVTMRTTGNVHYREKEFMRRSHCGD